MSRTATGQQAPPLPVAGVLQGLLRGDVHVGRQGLVYEGTEAHSQVTGGTVHSIGQGPTQSPQAEQVVVHGERQIHEVVKIDGIVLYLTDLHRETLGVV